MANQDTNQLNNTLPVYSSTVSVVDPSTLSSGGYELSNANIIESYNFQGNFTQDVNDIEFYIYDSNKVLIYSDYNFTQYNALSDAGSEGIIDVKSGTKYVNVNEITLQPERDISNQGFSNGDTYAVYNFINLELGSSLEVPYYLAEISADRTEIRLKSNSISTGKMKSTFLNLQRNLNNQIIGEKENSFSNSRIFDELYISFGNNESYVGINIKYDDTFIPTLTEANTTIRPENTIGQSSILIKLYDPLPAKYSLSNELYVYTKPAESKAYLVNFVNDFFSKDNIIQLRGPNSNLKLNDFVNTSGIPQNKNQLLATKSSGSKDQLLSTLKNKGITLTPNYSTASFNEFVNFSSAKARVTNFVEKLSRIQAYEADINTISQATASNAGNIPVSESIASLWTNIENEITSFDGFDYYQYYNTSSDAYPKTGVVFPLQLLATQSALAQNWITATENSASLYDEDNQNWLYYTVPDFIKENSNNNNYLDYVNMIGQSFDEIWLYTKAITKKLNTTNNLDEGIPLSLADDMITSLGYTGFGNNYNNQDNFIGLIGNDNGSYVPPTGSEFITNYIAVNGAGGIISYWDPGYSYEDYVEEFENFGFPYPIDRVSKEIFKRLYHNMSYLVKKKGTVSGLRQLINIWGIPNTILRINEFGGKNKDEEDDYDLWYQRYSYAYKPVPAGTNYASSSVRIPWQPLYRNYIHSHNQLLSTSEIAAVGTITGGSNGVSNSYGVNTQFTVTGGGSGGTLTITAAAGNVTKVILTQGNSEGYNAGSVITITGTQINDLSDSQLGTGWSGTSTFTLTDSNLGAEEIVPDGLGFRFKTTGYPSSSYGGYYNTQSLFVKKSDVNGAGANSVADLGIVLYYTGSTSGSHLGTTSSAYKDYGEMRFLISGSSAGGGTAISPPIYLPFFDKGWWSVQLQRDKHPIATDNSQDTTYTLFAANKIYDGADGNQIGFTGSVSLTINASSGGSASINESWNNFTATNIVAGGYLGGWGNTLPDGTGIIPDPLSTGSIGTITKFASDSNIDIGLSGKNFSGSFQEFRYYSHDISQSVFNDVVMNPESIEGNFITGSESSFDIVNFRAPLGNELEHIFTSSLYTQYQESIESVHPAITGSSPLTITASFYNPANLTLTSSYDVTYNANIERKTYSEPNVETYFLDQPSIGIRNRVSNKIRYSTNLNFGTVLSSQVSIQENPPISQSYTDNINSLEVAFSPTEEINDDIIQSLGYGAIQEVIADPRFRSSSDDYYPGLQAISKDYFKKYTNRSQIDYLRLIKYFDDSLFKAIKNYVPARTSVSTGIVIKQHMLERNRYREPQVNIVTTQSYAPFNQPLTFKNLELTGSITTHQLWNPVTQNTYYSSSDLVQVYVGPGGSVNQYNTASEGGAFYIEKNGTSFAITTTPKSLIDPNPSVQTSNNIVIVEPGTPNLTFLNAFKSVQTPLYVEYVFGGGGPATNVDITVQASSSKRGIVMTNTTTYLQSVSNPAGSILTDSLFDIHPEEDMYILVTSSPTAVLSDYKIGLGENSLIIPDNDTVPVSQQGYFTYNTTSLGIDTMWDGYQEQFYDGEFSGSNFSAGQYYNSQYNPYRKVKPNSTPVLPVPQVFTDNSGTPYDFTTSPTINDSSFTFVTTDNAPFILSTILGYTGIEIIPFQRYNISYDVTLDVGSVVTGPIKSFTVTTPPTVAADQSEANDLTGGAGNGGAITITDGSNYLVNSDPEFVGGFTVKIMKPGTGFLVGDVLSITGATGATLTVTEVGLGQINLFGQNYDPLTDFLPTTIPYGPQLVADNGGNTLYTSHVLTNYGDGYKRRNGYTTTGGSGTGLTVDVLSSTKLNPDGAIVEIAINNPGDGDYVVGDVINVVNEASSNAQFTITAISSGRSNGVELWDTSSLSITSADGFSTIPVSHSFNFIPPPFGDTGPDARYSLGFQIGQGLNGDVNNINIEGVGGEFERVKAPIFLTQQDEGYGNQADYQSMSNRDAQGNVIGSSPTGIGSVVGGINILNTPIDGGTGYTTATDVATTSTGIGTGLKIDFTAVAGIVTVVTINTESYAFPPSENYSVGDIITITGGGANATFEILQVNSGIWLIENTESVVFNNSDYNPLSNNANTNRSSSHRYVLSYSTNQTTPNNFQSIVTASYFPTSTTASFPEKADIPDSNYTMPSSVNARYAGTKLSSLTYNFFTPPGPVGPQTELPVQPENRPTKGIGTKVALEFIDGSVTSSFIQTGVGQGKPSWRGDSIQNKGESTIDIHPIYMARFENSFEQLNFYDSYQFNIDQLIEIPFESISGEEVTPNSITIDGSNESKKIVSSVFAPKRQASVNYLNPKTRDIDYTTMQVGNFDILGGSVEFLTLNSNAKSRVEASLRYQYELGGSPYTSSAYQTTDTIQMVTSSIDVAVGASQGVFNVGDILTMTNSPTIIGPTLNTTLTGIPVISTSGGEGATVDLTIAGSAITVITVVEPGQGYVVGGSVYLDQNSINAQLL